MYYLIVSGVLNVILNLMLVIGFHMGVEGVAIATLDFQIWSAHSLILSHLYNRDDEFCFRPHRMRMDKNELKRVLMIGIPAGIQGAIFSVSNVFIQSGINMFGEAAIAGSSLALNFEYFTYDIANAFAQAAVTFTSQNFGAGNMKRVQKDLRALPSFRIWIHGDPQRDFYRWKGFLCQHLHDERGSGGVRDHPDGSCAVRRTGPRHMRLQAPLSAGNRKISGAICDHDPRNGGVPSDLAHNNIPDGDNL